MFYINKLMFYILFQKMEGKGALSKSFYKASITLIPKPDKNSTKSNLHQFLSRIWMPNFLGGPVVESPPADTGDTGSTGPGRSCMPRAGQPRPCTTNTEAQAPQSLCLTIKEDTVMRSLCSTTRV